MRTATRIEALWLLLPASLAPGDCIFRGNRSSMGADILRSPSSHPRAWPLIKAAIAVNDHIHQPAADPESLSHPNRHQTRCLSPDDRYLSGQPLIGTAPCPPTPPWGTWAGWVGYVLLLLVFGIATLIKYLFTSDKGDRS